MKLSENTFTAEIRGNVFCLFEGIERMTEYSEDRIDISTKKGVITVTGTNLKLIYYSEDRIGIRGIILSITFGGTEC